MARNKRAKAAVHLEETALRRLLDQYSPEPVDNPFEALKEVAGRILAWSRVAEQRVAELDSIETYSDATGEQVRATVQVFERALDAARRVLVDMARLDIDARLARITEEQGQFVAQWIRAVIDDPEFDATTDQQRAFPGLVRRHLSLLRGEVS